jgi:hypothetical protein
MDTATVLEIIQMIDYQLARYARITGEDIAYVEKKEDGLVSLRDHLQEYIEQQVTYAENNLGNGE